MMQMLMVTFVFFNEFNKKKMKIFFFYMILNFFFIFMYKKNIFMMFNMFFFDWYSTIFMFVLLNVGFYIFFYSKWYFISEIKKNMFLLYLSLFMMFMFLFFIFNSLLFMLLGWEGIGMMSYLLINWWCGRNEAGIGGMQAVIYNRLGDFFIYLMLIMIFNFNILMNGKGNFIYFFLFLFCFSMIAKSSLFFFHPWLPNAMEGPTPVSSLLHSSTMVVAGVFLFIRFSVFFNNYLLNFMGFIGGLTMLYGGICSLGQSDMKKIIAYSTTSQLGFMIMMVTFLGSYYGMMFLVFHAFFKSLMFMMSGLYIHESNGIQNKYKMNLFNSKISSVFFIFSLLSLMGLPFFSGYFSKDLILENIWGEVMNIFVIFIFFFGCIFTISYSFKLMSFFKIKFMVKYVNMNSFFWMIFLGFFLFMNSFFFKYLILSEVFLNIFKKMSTVFLFLMGFFFMKFFSFKMNNIGFYNPIVHRIFNIFNKILTKYSFFLEYKWLESKFLFGKLPLFYGFKFIFFTIVIFMVYMFM
uniref:NADH:ubiquinone reductase (H(+)-translocating) n=1 Tax=Didemnum vexillum TaxID=516032 RepID=A0A0A7LFL1_9ASCI|nr:NADH dehydrogenase subunit 5 [Didemnum vexillum]AIZ58121.3 NADH dehydrogenase subunit 5 [Didemnum vexillum]